MGLLLFDRRGDASSVSDRVGGVISRETGSAKDEDAALFCSFSNLFFALVLQIVSADFGGVAKIIETKKLILQEDKTIVF